jgi:hypothetical protein
LCSRIILFFSLFGLLRGVAVVIPTRSNNPEDTILHRFYLDYDVLY